MRWFTDAAYTADDHTAWDQMLEGYTAHLASISASLPPEVIALASDPELNLHDAEFIEFAVDPPSRRIESVVRLANSERSRLHLRFADAEIVPDNYQALDYAIGAIYAKNRWGGVFTVIRAQEIDLQPSGRFVLRLRLWPFHEFAIAFGSMSLQRLPPSDEHKGPGHFILTGTEGQWNVARDRRVTFADAD